MERIGSSASLHSSEVLKYFFGNMCVVFLHCFNSYWGVQAQLTRMQYWSRGVFLVLLNLLGVMWLWKAKEFVF